MYTEAKSLSKKISPEWRSYSLWNKALSEHFFSGNYEDRPVYLDINDQLLADLGEEIGLDNDQVVASFISAISGTLAEGLHFDSHYYVAAEWRQRKEEEAPPFIALLAFFSYVAEKMVRDPNFAAHNYYGRLQKELGIDDTFHADLKKSYQEVTERFWPWLNEWLISWDGQLGLPTARALDNRRYVSVAISQALVREQDRNILKRVFAEHGLSPGQRLGKIEMLSLLLHWSSLAHNFNSLSKLIQRGGDIRDKVAEIACSELESWDGRLAFKDSAEKGGRLFYIATFTTYPQLKIELNLCATLSSDKCGDLILASDSSSEAKVGFSQCIEDLSFEWLNDFGVAVVEPYEKIAHGDALLGRTKLVKKTGSSFFVRDGQPICILMDRLDIGAYQEVSRIGLGQKSIVLVHQSIQDKVENFLIETARPGYKKYTAEKVSGLPRSWILFTDIQILKVQEVSGLEALAPLMDSLISVSGGLYLGNDSWLTSHPPEVTITINTDSPLSVQISQSLHFDVPKEKIDIEIGCGVGFVSIKNLNLPDGDYQITVTEALGDGDQKFRSGFKLRSSNSVRIYKRGNTGAISYFLNSENLIDTISAKKNSYSSGNSISLNGGDIITTSEIKINYPRVKLVDGDFFGLENSESIHQSRAPLIDTATKEAGSCLLRGYHIVQYAGVPPGMPPGYLVMGKCSDCSLTLWQATKGYSRFPRRTTSFKGDSSKSIGNSYINVSDITPISEEPTHAPSYRDIFDALCYVKEGTFERLSSIVRSVSGETWAPHNLMRSLASLGHLDYEIDELTLRPKSWRIADPTLVSISHDEFILTGWSSQKFINQFTKTAEDLGAEVLIKNNSKNLPSLKIRNIKRSDLDIFTELINKDSMFPLSSSVNFTDKLLTLLPKLSTLIDVLPVINLPNSGLEFFDEINMKWQKVPEATKTGAYRHQLNGTKYFYASIEKHQKIRSVTCDARLAKYFAMSKFYEKFLRYHGSNQELKVRVGMDLPFLYERVAVMCSGELPEVQNGVLIYKMVPKEIAEGLVFKLFTE